MKKIIAGLLIFLMCLLVACGENTEINSKITENSDAQTGSDIAGNSEAQADSDISGNSDAETGSDIAGNSDAETGSDAAGENDTETADDFAAYDLNYPCVDGYPVERDRIKLCKLYMNDYEMFCDAYIKDSDPDTVYVIALEPIYDSLNADGLCVGTSNNATESFGACINGHLIVNSLGSPYLNFDGEIFEDLPPEIEVVYEDCKDYCCTTLFLEKALDAEVHIARDKSAVYIEYDVEVSEEESKKYDLDLTAAGTLTATNKNDGSRITLVYDQAGMTSAAANTNAGGNSSSGYKNDAVPTRTRCSNCGGSGFTNTMQNVWDPASNMYVMKSVSGVCPSCGGTGYSY